MVVDPHLVAHLAHFGLDAKTLNKTEKTMTEARRRRRCRCCNAPVLTRRCSWQSTSILHSTWPASRRTARSRRHCLARGACADDRSPSLPLICVCTCTSICEYVRSYTGLANLGNSCYISSVLQVLFAIPEFQQRYADRTAAIFRAAPRDPTSDLFTQVRLALSHSATYVCIIYIYIFIFVCVCTACQGRRWAVQRPLLAAE